MTRRPLTRDEARERAALLHVSSYAVTLDLTTGPDTFRSTSRIRFGCRTPGAATFAEVYAPRVSKAALNGRLLDLDDVLEGNRLRLDLLDHTNELVVVAECAYSRSGEGLHRFVDPVDQAVYTYSQTFLYDAQRVFACFDQPDLKATFEISVVVPNGWVCVSNAAAVERPLDRTGGLWRFGRTAPLPTYVVMVAAGDYHELRTAHRDVPLGLYCRRSLAHHLDPDEFLGITAQALDFYEQLFDYPYPFGKYDQLAVPEFNAGAMENAGAVTFREERAVFRSRVTDDERHDRAGTIVHELAHMWFGDLVTMEWWDDLWLNEAFATWLSVHTLASASRFTTAWTRFCTRLKAHGYQADQLPSTHPVSGPVLDTDAALLNFDGVSYYKGASVLKQLTAWVGIEPFVAGLRAYVKRHEWGNTSLADLLAALEEASGRDLRGWADEWLRTTGVNTLRPELTVADDGTVTAFDVVQEAPAEHPTLRRHRIAVGCYSLGDEGLVRTQRVELDVVGARTPVPQLAGRLRPDLLLLNDDDLTFAKVRLDPASFATLRAHPGAVRDSLARALCWFAAWDMTRDGELAAREYARLAAAAAAHEDDPALLRGLVDNALTTVNLYAAEPAERRRELADLLGELLTTTDAGSDRHLALVRGWAAAAAESRPADVQDLLAKTDDVELRWHLLTALAAAGQASEAEVAAELAADPTASGELRAATARAARPDAAAKAAAWAAVVESDALSNHLVLATGTGFGQPGQDELLRPYVDAYFSCIRAVFATRPPEIAQTFAIRFYPWTVVSTGTLAATDTFLAEPDLDPQLRRLVTERRADLDRALRARAVDAASPS